jgi:gamma-D-glutamyl-L-lysine dipeptidyl-peptidase
MKRGLSTILVGLALSATVGAAAPPASAATNPDPVSSKVSPPATKYVDVSVATSWIGPNINRPGLADLAIGNPANPRLWVSSMNKKQKLALNFLLETQALYGTKVTVDEQVVVNGLLWDHAWVDGQPTPRDTNHYGGYPGWIPDQQLTAQPPPEPDGGTARVTGSPSATRPFIRGAVTAWAYDSAQTAAARGARGRLMELSFGTTLAVADAEPGWVEVLDNHRRHLYLNAADVSLSTPPATADQLIRTAQRFLRLEYLWAGLSSFGYDCSGFTHSLYASIGVEIPRDADAQADAAGNPSYTGPPQTGSAVGTWVRTLTELRPGDLVFFATDSGYIHHVGLYVGLVHGHPTMIDAPDTGSRIQQDSIDIGIWGKQFAGGGRFLG